MLLTCKLFLIPTIPIFVIDQEHMEFCKHYSKIKLQLISRKTSLVPECGACRTVELSLFAHPLDKDSHMENCMEVDSSEANSVVNMDKIDIDHETRVCSDIQQNDGGDCEAVSETSPHKIHKLWCQARL